MQTSDSKTPTEPDNGATRTTNYQSAAIINSVMQRLTDLSTIREIWESNDNERSNQSLYALLGECLTLYRDLIDGEQARLMKQGLRDYINLRGYSFKDTSPLSLKVIRCVFGDRDRRRISTYHTVLRVAIAEKWMPDEMASKIAERGGVQEISLRRPGSLTLKDKAKSAEAALMNQTIATLSGEAILSQFDVEQVGERAVALLTLNGDGSYGVHCIVRSSSAVTATLAGYFSANKAILSSLNDQQTRKTEEASRERLITEAAAAANEVRSSNVA